jgi:lipopolysaccharide/colanic/teichoic acid biosynthesis glycosyltransferase
VSVQALIVDCRPAYLQCARSSVSALLAPLGTETVVQQLWAQLLGADVQSLTVVPDFEADAEYRRAMQAYVSDVQFCTRQNFFDYLESCEPADLLLIVDPRCYPLEGYEFARLLHGPEACQLPRHLIQLQQNRQGAWERVIYDARLHVHCVQRLYEGVTQVEAAGVSASVLPAALARRLDAAASLSPIQVRRQLTARDIPNCDLPARGSAFDLSTEAGLLGLNRGAVLGTTLRTRHASGRRREDFSIWAGPDSSIDPQCRLYGPIVVHSGARIEPEAVVIGPAVLGPRAHVGRGALVCQCVFWPGARVGAGVCMIRRVLTGQAQTSAAPNRSTLTGSPQPAGNSRTQRNMRPRRRSMSGRCAPGGRWYPKLKRAIDFSAALVGLIALAPLLAVTGLLIKVTSRGPLLFRHEREGLHGRVFRCWKFRTMIERAHSQQRALYVQSTVDGPQFRMPNDPRVTRLGRLLRAANIDELPQLYNVLRGDMSLIGPRPSPFRENQICIPWRKARLSVRPGITGLWQVCRRERDAGDFHQWIYFDVLYVRHLSLWLDLRILLATFLTMGGRWSVPLRLMISQAETERLPEALEPAAWLEPNVGLAPRPSPAAAPAAVPAGPKAERRRPRWTEARWQKGREL